MAAPAPVKFLIVDDKDENLFALEKLLTRPGLDIVRAKSGHEALERVLSNEVALAILDVQMPEMDGFELATLMRGTQRFRQIPIIFLTAGALDERRRFQGYEAGAVDFLVKPIEPEILRSKADVFFELHRQRQELQVQRDELILAAERNSGLYAEIQRLNETLEERVDQRTTQLLEANEQLQSFTYSVAHDFRQHIRGINVNSSIILGESQDYLSESRDRLQRIKDISVLMAEMTDDLLAFARIRRQTLRITDVDVSALAEEVTGDLKRSYPNVQARVAPGVIVHADKTLLRIVIENLFDNAFKYSHKQESPLVELKSEDKGFAVSDNGIGFNMAYIEKLWLPFERLLSDDSYGGTGIGLANVKRILERHGGAIEAESQPGKGATFHVRLDKFALI